MQEPKSQGCFGCDQAFRWGRVPYAPVDFYRKKVSSENSLFKVYIGPQFLLTRDLQSIQEGFFRKYLVELKNNSTSHWQRDRCEQVITGRAKLVSKNTRVLVLFDLLKNAVLPIQKKKFIWILLRVLSPQWLTIHKYPLHTRFSNMSK